MELATYRQWSIAGVLFLSLAGCAYIGWSKINGSGIQPVRFALNTVTIAALKQTPNVNTIVQVKGRVSKQAPLLGKTAYELQDATGSIWVLTTDAVPNVGDGVVLEGKLLYQSVILNSKEAGSVYLEQQRQLQIKHEG